MLGLILRRLAFLVAVVMVTTILTFSLSHMTGVDPARQMAGPRATPQQLAGLRQRYGLDHPLPVQYVVYLGHLLQGDFGTSLHTQRAVGLDLQSYLPATLELVLAALLMAVLGGMTLGTLGAVFKDGPLDALARLVALSGLTVPIFWLALLGQWLFYDILGWLPAGGQLALGATPPPMVTGSVILDSLLAGRVDLFVDALRHLLLPAIVLSFTALASITRMMRGSLVEVLRQDYMRTARAKGLPRRRVVLRHGLRNAIFATLTTIGLQFGGLLGGTVLVEIVFSWPGIGLYLEQAIQSADYSPILAVTTVIAALYVLANLAVDIGYVASDPRVRVR